MTPKREAKNIVKRFMPYAQVGAFGDLPDSKDNAKRCALLAVKMLIQATKYAYWEQVKLEIKKL